jgi:hypothetical protein
MKLPQLILDKLNNIDFCVKNNIIFYDYFKANNLSYPKGSKGLSFVTDRIFRKRELRFFVDLTDEVCFFNLVISDNWHLPLNLKDYFEKTNPILKSKLTIEDYKSNSEKKIDLFLIFLNEILYSEQIYKLITTDYWTEEYYVDMWGNYK